MSEIQHPDNSLKSATLDESVKNEFINAIREDVYNKNLNESGYHDRKEKWYNKIVEKIKEESQSNEEVSTLFPLREIMRHLLYLTRYNTEYNAISEFKSEFMKTTSERFVKDSIEAELKQLGIDMELCYTKCIEGPKGKKSSNKELFDQLYNQPLNSFIKNSNDETPPEEDIPGINDGPKNPPPPPPSLTASLRLRERIKLETEKLESDYKELDRAKRELLRLKSSNRTSSVSLSLNYDYTTPEKYDNPPNVSAAAVRSNGSHASITIDLWHRNSSLYEELKQLESRK